MGGGKEGEALEQVAARLMAAVDGLEAEVKRLRQEREMMARRIGDLESELAALRNLKGSVANRLDDSIRRVEGLLARAG
ncbi:MAG: hypothetical protein D6807_01290 [Alphaproteobacteria bacterium]|nr:MAG: hypothetical protein D6807_01290 [Alphaproteobacteria bacterium]